MKLIATILLILASLVPATAAETKLDGPALRELFNDVTLTSTENGRAVEQVFRASGSTFTMDVKTKALSQGFWRIESDKYCSQWPPSEHWSCYDVFNNDQGVVFVSSSGTRYQMALPPAN